MNTNDMAALQQAAVGYGRRIVLEDLDFALRRGEIFVLLGPNGAGKSTLLKTMSRALPPVRGRVLLDGRDMRSFSNEELAARSAVMLTDRPRPELMTVRDVVSMGRYPYTGRFGRLRPEDEPPVRAAMEDMELLKLGERDFRELSDGQKQRTLLARALAQEPELLVLDEPTGYLDIHYKLRLLKVLKRKAAAGMTVLASLHEIELARLLADRLLTVKDGHAEHLGTASEIFRPEIIAPLYDIREEEYQLLYG